jgi:hypothetical protein
MNVLTAHLQRQVYYNTDELGEKIQLSSASIFSAIDGALSGKTRPINAQEYDESWGNVCPYSLTIFSSSFFLPFDAADWSLSGCTT